MYHQNHLLDALRTTAYASDPSPGAYKSEWRKDGLDPDFTPRRSAAGDDYVPSGVEKFDAVVRAANPRLHYGAVAGYSRVGRDDGTGKFEPGTEFDYIGFPPMANFNGSGAEQRANYIRTMAHELVHWTQGEGRGAARTPAGMSQFDWMMAQLTGRPPISYVQEELTAEMGATLLMDAVGVDPLMPARASYVANWLSAADPDLRETLLDRAQVDAKRAVNWLLSNAGMEVRA